MERSSGILMPIFSLPSKFGIGSFGKESYKFIDFLYKSNQKVWQILPLVQTGYGNSPYSSICSKSFNPYFISMEGLYERGLITKEDVKFAHLDSENIDYGSLYAVRYPLLRKAFLKFDKEDKDFKKFVKSKEFYDYALFMAIKNATGQKHFYDWDEGLKRREKSALRRFARNNKEEILFWQFVQFIAKSDWLKVKKYANEKGISIIGDMPLYVALDSVDVWVNPKYFKLDDNFKPKKVAGVPPDFFSKTGQLWGNPVYDYDKLKEDNFNWWVDRIENALSIYDYVRIDHFRALDRYYEVDCDREDAIVGEWIDVPSDKLFSAIHTKINKERIIAEDLGIIDDGVRALLKKVGYPGMKILSFAFNGDEENLYLPQNIQENSICYTGTHDNDTLLGLINNASEWDKNNLIVGVKDSLDKCNIDFSVEDDFSLIDAIILLGFNSKAKLFIMPMQDLLKLDGLYRINQPGIINNQNWAVRLKTEHFNSSISSKLKKLTKKYSR